MQGNETEDKKRMFLKDKQLLEQQSEQETLSVYKCRKVFVASLVFFFFFNDLRCIFVTFNSY